MIVMSGKVKVINRLQFAPDASALAAGGWRGFQVWEQFAPSCRARGFAGAGSVDRFAFLPRSKRVYTTNWYNTFRVDLETGALDLLHWGLRIGQFALSPDGRHILLSSGYGDDLTLSCRETDSAHTLVWERRGVSWGAEMQFLPSGGSVLGVIGPRSQRADVRFVLHDVDSGQETHRSDVLPEYSLETIVSPDESLVACLTRFRIRIYPLRAPFREPLTTLLNDANRHFTGIAFHPSGRYLAATSNDKTVKLYDTTTWDVARTFTWNIGRMRSVCFSADGTLAAAGSDKAQVVVWDVDV